LKSLKTDHQSSNINPPKLKLGQGVLHGDLQTLPSNIVDKHSLTLKIEEVKKFQRRLSVKQNLKKFLSLETLLE
jgi:hypothetical protein